MWDWLRGGHGRKLKPRSLQHVVDRLLGASPSQTGEDEPCALSEQKLKALCSATRYVHAPPSWVDRRCADKAPWARQWPHHPADAPSPRAAGKIDQCCRPLPSTCCCYPPTSCFAVWPPIYYAPAACSDVLLKEPSLLEIGSGVAGAEVVVVGDLHGQFSDLQRIFERLGRPGSDKNVWVFLGDYIDRGERQAHARAATLGDGVQPQSLPPRTRASRCLPCCCAASEHLRWCGTVLLLFLLLQGPRASRLWPPCLLSSCCTPPGSTCSGATMSALKSRWVGWGACGRAPQAAAAAAC
jgi:hypothetical protein